MNCTQGLGGMVLSLLLIGACAGCASGDRTTTNKGAARGEMAQQKSNKGIAQGESSQQKSQQGIGVQGGDSSNVILGGPEIIIGQIKGVQGEEYSIKGDHGQAVKLRMTKDTNRVCVGGEGAKMSTGQQETKEGKEIPISPATEEQMKSHDAANAQQQMQALNDPNRQQAEHEMRPPSKDPSQLKDVVGSTDPEANKDVARGSGFSVAGSSGCQFKEGDYVRVEASDMGTITTIKSMTDQERAAVTGKRRD
jgi:hypothetical protein